MEKIVFTAEKYNWGLTRPGDWHHTEWKIYDDMSVKIQVYYNDDNGSEMNSVISTTIISNRDFTAICKNVEKARMYYMFIEAIDGEAWAFEMVGEMTGWKYPLAYIYGRKELERISRILERLAVSND